MKKFNWKLAQVTLLKTFLATFFTPFVGTTVILNSELIESVYVGIISSVVMCGIVSVQILDRFKKLLEENDK